MKPSKNHLIEAHQQASMRKAASGKTRYVHDLNLPGQLII
jgi:hypothetical protein